MKPKQTLHTKTKLKNLIKNWKISQPLIAQRIKMPVGTFKNKLNETSGLYKFTDEEFLAVATEIDKLMAECQNFLAEVDRNDADLL